MIIVKILMIIIKMNFRSTSLVILCRNCCTWTINSFSTHNNDDAWWWINVMEMIRRGFSHRVKVTTIFIWVWDLSSIATIGNFQTPLCKGLAGPLIQRHPHPALHVGVGQPILFEQCEAAKLPDGGGKTSTTFLGLELLGGGARAVLKVLGINRK